MADDYTIIQPGGRVWDKAETLASLRSEQRHWEAAGSDELSVRIYGDTAVVIRALDSQRRQPRSALRLSSAILPFGSSIMIVGRSSQIKSTEINEPLL